MGTSEYTPIPDNISSSSSSFDYSLSVYYVRYFDECFIIKLMLTSHKISRSNALWKAHFTAGTLGFGKVKWHVQGHTARSRWSWSTSSPVWLQSQTHCLYIPDQTWLQQDVTLVWILFRSSLNPVIFFSTRNKLLFVAHELENRWPLEILQIPWDLPLWNVKAQNSNPGALGATFFTLPD